MQKIFSILFILLIFIGFSVFEINRKSDNVVLDIINPYTVQVDLNSNQKIDIGETVCITDVKTFTSDLNQTNPTGLGFEDGIKIGYLTDIFAENNLRDKRVKIKFSGEQNSNCRYGDLIINNESYREKLINTGFAIKENEPYNINKFNQQLEKAKKLNLSILNHKSNKYHKLNCKYGIIAHDAIVIPTNQIAKDGKPCKFCHITKQNKAANYKILTYPLVISSGSIKMFLTDLTTTLKPDKNCNTLVCREILTQINTSKNSIDIALYGWDYVDEIYKALKSAKSRGVKINIVYDTSTNNFYPETNELIELSDKSATETPKILMHNKFMIFDNARVITGSMNFSKTGFSGFNTNCIFFINSVEIASIYKQEFNQMLSGKFHGFKSKIQKQTVLIGNTKITPFFSPKDKVIITNVIPLINNAKNYIYIPAFIITHDELTTALINAKNRGVDVKLIIDATNTTAKRSKVKTLRLAKVPVKVENYAGKVHSKSIIIDDKYIIAGSMNFSNSGENKNDENCLIIEDERLARYYRGFFEYLWSKIPDKYLNQNVRAEGKNSIGSCNDGIDNNYDGKIDLEDAACN